MLLLALTTVASTELLGEARANFNWTVGVRRKLHATPELLYELDKTSALVRATLDELKIPYQWPVARQGIVATLGSGKPPCVALRADMDALPIHEDVQCDFKSKTAGKCTRAATTRTRRCCSRRRKCSRRARRRSTGR